MAAEKRDAPKTYSMNEALRKLGLSQEDQMRWRNAVMHKIYASGSSFAQQSQTDYAWFQEWAETKLPDLLADGYVKALNVVEDKERTWWRRMERALKFVAAGAIGAVLTFFIVYLLGLWFR